MHTLCRPLHPPFAASSRPSGGGAAALRAALRQRGSGHSMLRLPPIVPSASAGNTAVAESLHLLRFSPEATEEEVAQVVDGIWSLQYLAAGPICGSAGPLVRFSPAAPAAGQQGTATAAAAVEEGAGGDAAVAAAQAAAPFSHAVLFRYVNDAALARFEAQPRVQLMLGGTGAPPGTGITTLNFRGSVPNELEAIFRRGSEWGEGVELVLALALQEGAAEDEAAEFLALTQQLALSSAFGAVQCSYGPCVSMQQHRNSSSSSGSDGRGEDTAEQQGQQQGQQQQQQGQQGTKPDMVLLARFQEDSLLQAFLDCPPVAALLEGDDRLPLRALWSAALVTEPSESIKTEGVGGGGLM